nr:homeobox-DDT domain protein RLT1-like isoform X1 [Tanacetum cinerariifolium]
MEGTVFALAFEGMKHVKSEEEEMLSMPFLDVCKHILPVIGNETKLGMSRGILEPKLTAMDAMIDNGKPKDSNQRVASIASLDYETLQTLDSFRDHLCVFPPKSVQVRLKRPFSVHPWIDSEEHYGNLFLVWRFCMTFLDVLGLWPFTLDEFVQSLHDYINERGSHCFPKADH